MRIQKQQIVALSQFVLTKGSKDFPKLLVDLFQDPSSYPQLLQMIDEPCVLINYCLFIRNKVLSFLQKPFQVDNEHQGSKMTQAEVKMELVKLATSTQLMQIVQAQLNKNQNLWQKGKQKDQCDIMALMLKGQIWLSAFVYMNALLRSVNQQGSRNAYLQIAERSRNPLLGNLLAIILTGLEESKDSFDVMLQIITNSFEQQGETAGLIVIDGVLEQLKNFQKEYNLKKFFRLHGKNLMVRIIKGIQSGIKLGYIDMAIKALDLYRDTLVLYKNIAIPDSLRQDQQQQQITTLVPHYMISMNEQVLMMAKTLIKSIAITDRNNLYIISLQAIQLMATQVTIDDDSFTVKEQDNRFDANVFQIIDIMVNDRLQAPWEQKQRDDFKMQQKIINSITVMVKSHSRFCRNNPQIIFYFIQKIGQYVLTKIPIIVKLAEKHPLSKFFDLILACRNNHIESSQFLDNIFRCLIIFIEKIQVYSENQQFHDFTQKITAFTQFFDPVVLVLQTIVTDSNKFQILVEIIKQKNSYITTGGKQGWCLLRFIIQWLRKINMTHEQSINNQKMFILFSLFENTECCYIFQLAILLQIMIDHLLPKQSFNWQGAQETILGLFITQQTQYEVVRVIKKISERLIQVLHNDQNEFTMKYVVSLMVTLCIRMQNQCKLGQRIGFYWSCQDILTAFGKFILDFDVKSLENKKHHEERGKIFQLSAMMAMNSHENVYAFHYKITKNLLMGNYIIGGSQFQQNQFYNQRNVARQSNLLYFVDMSGLLKTKMIIQLKRTLIQLFLKDLVNKDQLRELFIHGLKDKNQHVQAILFNAHLTFLQAYEELRLLGNMYPIQLQAIYGNCREFFSEVYTYQNFQRVTELYQAFWSISYPVAYPKLPSVLYTHSSTKEWAQWLWKNLSKLTLKDVQILFYNTFMRKMVPFESHVPEEFKNKLFEVTDFPDLLLKLIDYHIQACEPLFWDNYSIIKATASDIFALYKRRKEQQAQSCFFSEFEDTFDSEKIVVFDANQAENMIKKPEYLKMMTNLATVQFEAELMRGRETGDYEQYQTIFIKEITKYLNEGRND